MIRLLIVDDEEETREGLKDFIPWNTLGIDVVNVASDGVYALELSQQFPPDIIITDVRMSIMDGITLATKLRESSPFCKVIFISGYADKEYLKSAIHLKAISYVEKPINLEEIQTAVKSAIKIHLEEKRDREAIDKGEHFINNDTALLLMSCDMELKEVKKKLSIRNEFFLNAKYYCTIQIKIRESHLVSAMDESGINFSNIVSTALNKNFNNYLIGEKEINYFVVHLCDIVEIWLADFNSSIYKLMSVLTESINQSGEIFISVGKWVTGIKYIKESYHSSFIAMKQLFFNGYGCVEFYKETYEETYSFDKNLALIFKSYIRENKKGSAISFIKSLTSNVRNCSNTNIDYIKDIYFTLALQLSQVTFERGLEVLQDNENHNEFIWKFISNKETLNELETFLLESIETFFQLSQRISLFNTPIFAIKQYIQKNYYKNDLTIKEIGEFIHLSPVYLCQIFKKETDITINQYITDYRMEKAKYFLKDRRMKLIEISNKVGYADANYFTRLFKKCTGITPSEYREKYLL